MSKLWAPWRKGYILNYSKIKGCIFCNTARSANSLRHYCLKKTIFSLCMLNIFPYNTGHLLVAPKRHVNNLAALNNDELLDMWRLIIQMQKLLDRVLRPQGYNIGINLGKIAGAGFDRHIHVHIVPRWLGDTNFMPVTAGTKVLPESLRSLYKRLKAPQRGSRLKC